MRVERSVGCFFLRLIEKSGMQKAYSILPQSYVTQTNPLEADLPKDGDSSHTY